MPADSGSALLTRRACGRVTGLAGCGWAARCLGEAAKFCSVTGCVIEWVDGWGPACRTFGFVEEDVGGGS